MTHSAQQSDPAARPQGPIIYVRACGVSSCGLSDAGRTERRRLDRRPTAPGTFADKGPCHAYCKLETCLRTLARVVDALRVADRPAVRPAADRRTVPALRSAGGGRRCRPPGDERIPPDALRPRRPAAANPAAAGAAAEMAGGVEEVLPGGRSPRNPRRRAAAARRLIVSAMSAGRSRRRWKGPGCPPARAPVFSPKFKVQGSKLKEDT